MNQADRFTERPRRYDVLIAGARCAGAATALLLARSGLRVLVVDPMRLGSDTLSTHALMRGAVLQLHRWGLLEAVRAAGTPAIGSTTFHYGDDAIEIPIKPRDGVEALFAPRRTLLDRLLLNAAQDAGADVVLGRSVTALLHDADGRVRGATVGGAGVPESDVTADLVIGADGVHSRVARLVGAGIERTARHATATIYSYRTNPGLTGSHWFYRPGASVGAIPTNDGAVCVFASVPPPRFEAGRGRGLDALYHEVLDEVSPTLARQVLASPPSGRLRAFAGIPGFLRRSAGPGWALVGDAGYFKDPSTAHGITDALRDAELLARAVTSGVDRTLAGYQATRDQLAGGLFAITDRIASFEWDLEEARALHLDLSREMNAEVDALVALEAAPRLGGVDSRPLEPV